MTKATWLASVAAAAMWTAQVAAQSAGAPVTSPGPIQPGSTTTPRAGETPTETDRTPANLAQQTGAPADTPAAADDQTIVVTGFRASLRSSIGLKRDATQIVDAIVAEDIGKLPDIAVSDSLARLPGIQVVRANGEAGDVQIRGLPDSFATTTYNNRDLFTAEARSVAIQDFIGPSVAALEVFKSTNANQIEGGLAGLLNVRSRRPFDFKGLEIAGQVRGFYTSQARDFTPELSLTLSNRWETNIGEIGVLVNANYTQFNYLDSARFGGGFIATAFQQPNGTFGFARPPGATDAQGVRFPDGVGIFYARGNRARPSANGSVQWRPNDRLEITFDALWQGFRRDVKDRLLFVPLFGGSTFSNVTFRDGENGLGQREAQGLTATGQVRPDGFQAGTREETDTYQFAINATYKGDNWRGSLDFARSDSTFDLSIFSHDYAFASAPTVNVNFDVPREDGGVEFDFGNFNTLDPANYVYRGFFDRRLLAKGNDYQFRADFTYEPGTDFFFTAFDLGLRYTDRDGFFGNGQRYSPQEDLRLPLAVAPLDVRPVREGFRGSDVQPVRQFLSPTWASIRNNVEFLRERAGFAPGAPAFGANEQFRANEKTYTGYLQGKYAFDLGGIGFDGVVGVRAIAADVRLQGTAQINAPGGPVFQPVESETPYFVILPSFNLRARLTEALRLRVAVTQTQTRATFAQLNPSVSIDPNVDPSGFRNASGGNPTLRPQESDNYDVLLEYYFGRTGIFAAGVFRREITNFIANQFFAFDSPQFGPVRGNFPVNLPSLQIQGVEAQFTAFADVIESLPDWAKGFGVQSNFTYLQQNNRDNFFVADLSEYSYNIIGIYERGPIATRLTYNYRSRFRQQEVGLEADGVSRLDFQLGITPFKNRNLTVTFDANNLLGQPFRNFFNYGAGGGGPFDGAVGRFPRDVRFEETWYSLTLRARL